MLTEFVDVVCLVHRRQFREREADPKRDIWQPIGQSSEICIQQTVDAHYSCGPFTFYGRKRKRPLRGRKSFCARRHFFIARRRLAGLP